MLDKIKTIVSENPIASGVVFGVAGTLATIGVVKATTKFFHNRSVDIAHKEAEQVVAANEVAHGAVKTAS